MFPRRKRGAVEISPVALTESVIQRGMAAENGEEAFQRRWPWKLHVWPTPQVAIVEFDSVG